MGHAHLKFGLDESRNADTDAPLLRAIGTDLLRAFIAVVIETWIVGECRFTSYARASKRQ